MQFEESKITKLLIKDVPKLDPVTVYVENYGDGRGKLTIEVFGESWSAYWGAMGENTSLEQFVLRCDNHYLSKNLSTLDALSEDDYEGFVTNIKKEILEERRHGGWSKQEARKKWDLCEDVVTEKEWFNDSFNHDTLYEIGGCEWWHSIPSKDTQEYKYLCRILDAVKECFRQREVKAAA